MWELQPMRLDTIVKRLFRDSMLLFVGFCISFALLFSLSVYTGKQKPQEELLSLTFSSWNPEKKEVKRKSENKKIVKKNIKQKPKVIKPKIKPMQKPRAVIAEQKPILNAAPVEKLIKPKEVVVSTEETDSTAAEVLPVPTPVFQLTTMPKFLHKKNPEYPSHLRNTGVEGMVKLQLLIDEKGKVRKVSVLRSAGDGFDNAAMRAMYKSTFIPAKVNNKSVAVLLTMPITFRLM